MRIISKFRDFYDNVSHRYLDTAISFIREMRVLQFSPRDFPEVRAVEIDDPKFDRTIHLGLELIGFCGKIYPVAVISTSLYDSQSLDRLNKNMAGFYDIESLRAYCLDQDIPIQEGNSKYSKYLRFSWYRPYNDSFQGIERFFNSREDFSKLEALFSKYNTPYFVLREPNRRAREVDLVLTPMLKNFSFIKVRDPFSTHQDISMYVGGVLRQPEKPMIELTDIQKAEKRGFDKWSFRKPPKDKK